MALRLALWLVMPLALPLRRVELLSTLPRKRIDRLHLQWRW